MKPSQKLALERLLMIAGRDTGQSRRVAEFLLAWWNAGTCGGFDLTNLFAVDHAIARDMMRVIALIQESRSYPDSLGYGPAFERIVASWRPELVAPTA